MASRISNGLQPYSPPEVLPAPNFPRSFQILQVVVKGASGSGNSVTSDDITHATSVGKSVLTAEKQATARTAIGAGTSNLGGEKKMAAQIDSAATDVAGLLADFNALLAKARTAGLI